MSFLQPLLAKALVRENQVREALAGAELQRDLGLLYIGARRFPGPRKAQERRRLDAAILSANHVELVAFHADPVGAAHLKIDLGDRRREIVAGRVPIRHAGRISPGPKPFFHRRWLRFAETNLLLS